MKPTKRYIDKTYAHPFVNELGELCINWCGEVLKVIGITTEGAWIVPAKNNQQSPPGI